MGACALIRTVELPALANTTDVTYDLVPLACWSMYVPSHLLATPLSETHRARALAQKAGRG